MLTTEEEKFVAYWEENRDKYKGFLRRAVPGLLVGLCMGVGIVLSVSTGWYSRATMVANSQSTPILLILAIILISIFCSVFYQRHRWDMNDQRYREIKARGEKG